MNLVKSQVPNPKSQGAWVAVFGIWVLGFGIFAAAAQGLSREEALAQVYPGAQIRAEQIFLTAEQMAEVSRRAGSKPASPHIARYLAERSGEVAGRAYVDTHIVRTKRESLLISLDAQRRVLRVDVTAFLEPSEFRASGPWLGQYRGRSLDDELAVDRAIRPIAGATLTARAANSAVRRVLAIDELLNGTGGGQ